MTRQINPAWLNFKSLINEGGEGFNPHPKYVGDASPAEPAVLNFTSASGFPISRDEAEYLLRKETQLLQDAEQRSSLGDFFAAVSVDRIRARVAHYAAQLS